MNTAPSPSLHALLLLSDSALPLGSFAFSSGLESYLSHHKPTPSQTKISTSITHTSLQDFTLFLHQSLQNTARTSLPYLLCTHSSPASLPALDDVFDAATPCTVARRASTVQGRALLTLWDRSLRSSSSSSSSAAVSESESESESEASHSLLKFSGALKENVPDALGLAPNGHFAPLFGVVCRAMGLGREDAAYVFLLNQAKSVVSAGVRASVLGPYQGQMVLSGRELRAWIEELVREEVFQQRDVSDAGIAVPVMDLWMGRHELLYSRIFNS